MPTATELIAEARAAVTNLAAGADSFLAELKAIAGSEFSPGIPTAYNYLSVPTVEFPVGLGSTRPDVSISEITGAPAAPEIAISVVQDITLPEDDLLVPTHQFEYFERAYESTLLDPLKTKLLNDLASGSYGIEPADEQALHQRARDRETEASLARVGEVGRSMAARGFPISSDELALYDARAYQDAQNRASGLNRDIYVDRAKRAIENRQFTIQQVKEVESILIGFHNSVQERALNVARASAEFAIALYNALVARQRIRLERAKTAADVQAQKLQAEAARAQAVLGVFQGQIAVYEANLRRSVSAAQLLVARYQADVQSERTAVDGLVAKNTLQQKVLEATRQQNLQIDQLNVENTKARLLAEVEVLKNRVAAAQFGAQRFTTVLVAMINTVNTLAVQTTTEE